MIRDHPPSSVFEAPADRWKTIHFSRKCDGSGNSATPAGTPSHSCRRWQRDRLAGPSQRVLVHPAQVRIQPAAGSACHRPLRADRQDPVHGPRGSGAIAPVHTRVPWKLQGTHRASDLREPLSGLDFELCNLLSHRGDPGKDAAWRQPQGRLVRVVGPRGWSHVANYHCVCPPIAERHTRTRGLSPVTPHSRTSTRPTGRAVRRWPAAGRGSCGGVGRGPRPCCRPQAGGRSTAGRPRAVRGSHGAVGVRTRSGG